MTDKGEQMDPISDDELYAELAKRVKPLDLRLNPDGHTFVGPDGYTYDALTWCRVPGVPYNEQEAERIRASSTASASKSRTST